MRIIFLTQAFPPHPEVGALRSRNVVNALLADGHEVTLITERVSGAGDPAEAAGTPRLQVRRIDAGERFLRRLQTVLGGLAPPQLDAGNSPAPGRKLAAGVLRRTVLSLLSLPDTDQHLILPFYRAARAALREAPADLIYTSAPPFSMQIVGYLLRRRTGIPWVAEYRDPWTHPWTDREVMQNRLVRWLDARLERIALRRADALVTVTESTRDLLAGRLPTSGSMMTRTIRLRILLLPLRRIALAVKALTHPSQASSD